MINVNNTFYFPDQTIPENKKDQDWHINHAISYVISDRNSFNQDENSSMSKVLRAYLCMQNDEEQKACRLITHPHGVYNGVEYQIYNLIEQKVEQLIGDYMSRPMIRKAYVMNSKARNRKLDAKIEMVSEQIFRQLAERAKRETGIEIQTPNPQLEIPEDVERLFSEGKYKDVAEEVSDDLVTKFLDVDKQAQEVRKMLLPYFLYDRVSMTIDEKDGKVQWWSDDPFMTDYDLDPEKDVQDDPQWYIKGKFMTENDIYNKFSLTKTQKSQVRDEFTAFSNYRADGSHLNNNGKDMGVNRFANDRWYVKDNQTFRIFVVDMTWKSPMKIRGKRWTNKDGIEVTTKISDKARVKKNEEEIVEYIEKPRHVVLCGPSICLSWGEEEHRMYSIDSPEKCRLNRVALNRQNTVGVSTSRSVGQKLLQMQEWCSEILYEIRFAMRKNKGKAFVYDTAQTPKAYLKMHGAKNALQRVFHHIGKDQVILINSKEKKNNYAFNQFTTVDLSNQQHIQNLIDGLTMVELLADKMIGFTPGRQGQSEKYVTATSVQAERQASFSRTEIYYRPFDDFLKAGLEVMLMKSKFHYKENETIHYVIGDDRTKWLRIAKEWFDSSIGLYFGDSAKDMRKKEIIDQIATQSLGNAQTPEMISALIDVLFEDTAIEAKKVLKTTVQAMSEAAEARNQQALQVQQAEMQQKAADAERADETQRRAQDKDIVVADIYADNKAETEAMKVNSNERIKLAEQRLKK